MTMTRFERWAVWLTTAGTLITGLAYWWMKEMMTPPDPWAVVNHPLQPWLLKAHILIAPALVFSVGLLTSRHIWRHFRMGVKKGRRSGLLAMATFVAMVGTGYALQVVTADLLLRILAWSHLALGIVYSIGVALHWPATRGQPYGERQDPLPGSVGPGQAGPGTPGRSRENRPARRTRATARRA